MLPSAVVPVAETTRSGVVESIHFGAVVALGADGVPTWSAGDPDIDVYPRSALKPLQAQAMVDAGLRRRTRRTCGRRGEPQRRADPPRGRPANPGQGRPRRGRPRQHAGAPAVAARRRGRAARRRAGERAAAELQRQARGDAVDVRRQRVGGRELPRVRAPRAEGDRCLHRRGGWWGQPHRGSTDAVLRRRWSRSSAWRSPCGRWRSASQPSTRRCAEFPQLVAGTGREDTVLMRCRAGTDRQGRCRGDPRRRPSRWPGGRRQGGRRFGTGADAGDARRPAVARLRRRRRARAADPRPRPPGRRGPRPRRRVLEPKGTARPIGRPPSPWSISGRQRIERPVARQ